MCKAHAASQPVVSHLSKDGSPGNSLTESNDKGAIGTG